MRASALVFPWWNTLSVGVVSDSMLAKERRPLRELRELLVSLFSPGELEIFVGEQLGRSVLDHLRPLAPFNEQTFGLVVELDRRGEIDLELFTRLIRMFPGRRGAIAEVAALWGYHTLVPGLSLLEALYTALIHDHDPAAAVCAIARSFDTVYPVVNAQDLGDTVIEYNLLACSPGAGAFVVLRKTFVRTNLFASTIDQVVQSQRKGLRDTHRLESQTLERYKFLPHVHLDELSRKIIKARGRLDGELHGVLQLGDWDAQPIERLLAENAAGGVSASVTSRIFVGDRRRLVSSEAWVEAKRLVAADIGLSSLQSFFVSLLSRFALRSECLSPELRGFIAKDLRASSSAG